MRKWLVRLVKGFLKAVVFVTIVSVLAIAAQWKENEPVDTLRARWGTTPSRFVDVDGMPVHYRDEGAGPVIVLLHGTGASLHTWDGWAKALVADGRRVVRMDLPAFGLTGPHPANDYRIETYVEFVEHFAKKIGLQRFALAGNSLGGGIAWRYAVAHPERTTALVLVDPNGYPPTHLPLALRMGKYPALAWLGTHLDPHFLVARTLKTSYGDPSRVTKEQIGRYRDMALRDGNRAAFAARTGVPYEDHTAELATLKLPTLIVWGALDHVIPIENAQKFASAIAGSELKVYPTLGHVPMEEDPATTVADVRAFLGKLPR